MLYFFACGMHFFFLLFFVERTLVFFVVAFSMWNVLWYSGLYFPAFGICSVIVCYIFLCLGRTLVFHGTIFDMWNALWYFVIYSSTHGTRSGIFCYFFVCWIFCGYLCFSFVELALIFYVLFSISGTRSGILCDLFHVSNALWYFVFYIFSFFLHLLLYLLTFLFIDFIIFRSFETIFDLRDLVLLNFVLYFSAIITYFGIVYFCVVFFRLWNTFRFCGILCYTFPPVLCSCCMRFI